MCWCQQAALNGRYLVAGLAGATAVLFRQTNAVWVAFILAVQHPLKSFFWANLAIMHEVPLWQSDGCQKFTGTDLYRMDKCSALVVSSILFSAQLSPD